ncbi:MAG TPA: hypothetical protein PK095_20590, partial [Myxococcota bacterium]|nr:hypothetical protein [Myxococcota bacterium]
QRLADASQAPAPDVDLAELDNLKDALKAAERETARLREDVERLEGELEAARGTERELDRLKGEVERLETELSTAREAAPARGGDDERVAELEALQRDLEKSLAKAEDRATDLADENDRLSDKLKELERASQRGGVSEEDFTAVKEDLERTTQKLDRMREQLEEERARVKELEAKADAPAMASSGGGEEALKEELDLVYQDINAITRDWRTSVETLGDLVGEVQTSAGSGSEPAFDQISEILTNMNDASSGMKQALKQMRSLLSGED